MRAFLVLLGLQALLGSSDSHGLHSSSFSNFIASITPNFHVPDTITPRFASATPSPNYTFTEWTEFSTCSKVCGGGKMERSRQCLDDNGHLAPIIRCSKPNQLTTAQLLRRFLTGSQLKTEVQQKTCNQQDCSTTEWDEWGQCNRACGGGTQYATRACLDSEDQSKCNFQSIRRRSCNEVSCYRLKDWGEWGECSRKCNGGLKRKRRDCAPNVDESHPEYKRLLSVIQRMDSYNIHFSLLSSHASSVLYSAEYLYIEEYLKTCDVKRQESTKCNTQSCPKCPKSQTYSSCKPCVKTCQPTGEISARSTFTYNMGVEDFIEYATGCGGICEEGCTCPFWKPYLGADNICYAFQWQCPSSEVTGRSSQNGAEEESSIPSSTAPSTESYEATTAVASVPEAVTEPDMDTTPGPIEEEQQPEASTAEVEANSSEQPSVVEKCSYGRLIATTPGHIPCECDGDFEPIPCYSSGDTSCPVICNKPPADLVCPPAQPLRVILKSASSTCDDRCADNTDCAVGDLCCETSCGRKCLNGVAP